MNISRYILPPLGAAFPPLADTVRDFKAALARGCEAEVEWRQVMEDGGWLEVNRDALSSSTNH